MKIHIFAEGSSTTTEDPEVPVQEYYQGLFGMVAGLNEELGEFAETHLHVLSEEYGVVRGSELPSDILKTRDLPVGEDEMMSKAKDELLQAATSADVMVILFSTDIFRATVTQLWDELVGKSKPESIWCLGAARSALEELNLSKLESKGCSVLVYQRVGVARIGSETRKELLEAVKRKSTQ